MTPNDDSVQEVETQEDFRHGRRESRDRELQAPAISTDPQRRDARELFNAWNDPDGEGEPDELAGAEAWSEAETPEQVIEEGEVAYNYDEWDRELTDHRLGWCRVIEKSVKHGDREFVEQTRERHKGVISSIRHQFQLMKPEDLTRVTNELDGEEFDLNAVIDYVIDRRAASRRRASVRAALHQAAAAAARRGGLVSAGPVVIDRAHDWSSSAAALHATRAGASSKLKRKDWC